MVKNNKRIGFVLLHKHAGVGGVEKVLTEVANGLGENIESFVYFIEEPTDITFFKNFKNVRCYRVPKLLRNKHIFRPKYLYKYFLYREAEKLFSALVADDLDVVLVIGLGEQVINYSKYLDKIKSTGKIKMISWVHGSTHKLTSRQIEAMIVFDHFFTVSQGIATQIKSYGYNNVSVVYNPVDEAELIKRKRNSFLYIGRIDDNKRVHELIDIFSSIDTKDYTFDIYGSTGDEKEDIKFVNFINQKGLSQCVIFHGWKKEPWSHIDRGSVLLLNSKSEGLPLVLIEAMMRGVACLSSDCRTGPSDIIIPNINGWLYDVDDKIALKDYLERLLNKELGVPSQETIKNSVCEFESKRVLKNFKQLVLIFC